jgi:glycerate 2-kinase
LALLHGLRGNDLVIFVLSGGGSALLPLPQYGISLEEKQRVTKMLLDSGASIDEMNALRKHISKVKGGQLARVAYPATVISLLLSDVVGDRLDVIASGPTVPDESTFRDCVSIAHVTVASNIMALNAAEQKAEELGYNTLIQEFVLAIALEIAGMSDTVLLSCGTDGTDGPTDTAGALADGLTIQRAEKLRMQAMEFLQNNDSYHFFEKLDDLIKTGPTNTNVMDVRLLLVR